MKAVFMPFVMLRPDRPGTFRRTITTGKKGREVKVTKVFARGVPVELTAAEVDALRSDIGPALVPVEFDAKARPRVITDDVTAEEATQEASNEPQPVNA